MPPKSRPPAPPAADRRRVNITRSVGATTVERLRYLAERCAERAAARGVDENPRRLEGRVLDELVAERFAEEARKAAGG